MWAWANLARRVRKPRYEKPFERILTPEGDNRSFFELAWLRQPGGTAGDKVVLLAPGLSGGAYSRPTRGMVRALHERKWDVAVWVFRDTGMEPTSVARTYSGNDLDDLELAVDALDDYGEIALVGTSLGGAAVLQYAARSEPRNQKVKKVVAISPPLDFGSCVEAWSRGFIGKLFISPFSKRGMQRKARAKQRSTGAITRKDVAAYAEVRTMIEADHYVNTAFNDYDSASDYWYKATTVRDLWVGKFTAQTLIIVARDDFLLDARSYPHSEHLPENVTLELPRHGSHLGFVPRGRKRVYWSEERTVAHLNS